MPTKKPVLQIVLEKEYHSKLSKLASNKGRSASNQGARIIEKYIDEYENEPGTIDIGGGQNPDK